MKIIKKDLLEIKDFIKENYPSDIYDNYLKSCQWLAGYQDSELLMVVGIERYNERLVTAKHFIIKKSHQNQGLGTKITKEYISHLEADKVLCHVKHTNLPSIKMS